MRFEAFWAPACAKPRSRERESGFTLVELVIALLIFGMLAAAGVGLLRFSVDAQAATKSRLDAISASTRRSVAIASDAAQAVPRTTRNEAGDSVQAFEGDGQGFVLVRAGVDPLTDIARPSLQKVAYRLEKGALIRQAWPMLDGAQPGPAAVLARDVSGIQLRYRSKDGWRELWDPLRPDLLPRAIELVVSPVRGPQIRYLFLVGAGA
jgi:general secretion pathway protein J